MEQFKLDLTQLTPVEEKDRVKGAWYVLCYQIDLTCDCSLRRWHSKKYDMNQGGECSTYFVNWFAIPPNLPGFPKAELPDEFQINDSEWEFKPDGCETFSSSIMGGTYRRTKPALPELTIPSGTKSEQIEAVRKLLAELETK